MIKNIFITTVFASTIFAGSFSSILNFFEIEPMINSNQKLYQENISNHENSVDEEDYLFFCNGIPCQNHDIKSVIKEITVEGQYVFYTPEELIDADFTSFEDWQLIYYTAEELNELNIIPEDCTQSSVDNGTCGFGIIKNIEFVEFRTINDPPLLKGVDMNPFTDVLHLELNPPYIESGYSVVSYGCKVELLEYDITIHTYHQSITDLNCYFNIPEELQGDQFHIEISTFLIFENNTTGIVGELFRFMAEVGTND